MNAVHTAHPVLTVDRVGGVGGVLDAGRFVVADATADGAAADVTNVSADGDGAGRGTGPRDVRPWPPRSGRIAFFDVDETLIAAKSLLDFWEFWRREEGEAAAAPAPAAPAALVPAREAPAPATVPGPVPTPATAPVTGLAPGTAPGPASGPVTAPGAAWGPAAAPGPVPVAAGCGSAGPRREEANRAYYRRYAGVPVAALEAAGRRWYAAYRRRPDALVRTTAEALARHRAAGDGVVLVSGSCRSLLLPLAQDVGADLVCCTEQLSEGGVFTGEAGRPMIGDTKADAVSALLAESGIAAGDCIAYGDHSSDLAMLRAVGQAVVVGADPVLNRHARQLNWPVWAGG
ncbi:HAD-IB family hydrolase [Streptomyces sp. NPDC006743]|uniref:HAD-IB family hydrolase n=1 Tax=Streptomyces sp. NPDC006743 TaxID=3154480 RepID=UPI0034561E65